MDKSMRGGDNTRKAQKHQNSFTFRHNKNSLLTKKIRSVPLDRLCKRCLEQVEWRITYRKYKPLGAPGRCNICEEKTIYKAYRTICDKCAEGNKFCSKCCEPVKEYSKPHSWKNDPNHRTKVVDPLDEILKTLKERYKRTVERRIDDGEDLLFDEQKGIINEKTGEIVIDIKLIRGDLDNSMMVCKENDGEESGVQKNLVNNTANKEKRTLVEEMVDTYSGQRVNIELSDNEEEEEDNFDEECQ